MILLTYQLQQVFIVSGRDQVRFGLKAPSEASA